MSWDRNSNIAGLPPGSFRSINGYANESLAIGRALQCGYNLFFKAWRDSHYDAVLDYNNTLFRIEIKGSGVASFGVTTGHRAGAQIDRRAASREHILTTEECDFLIATHGLNGTCYIIPVEVIQILAQKSLSLTKLECFEEKWGVFKGVTLPNGNQISSTVIKTGFRSLTIRELDEFCRHNNITRTTGLNYPWNGFRGNQITGLSDENKTVLDIWLTIYNSA
jgi:hypothetical protein